MNSHDLLEMDEVSKTFPGVRALKGVTLHVPAGHVRGIVGENGAGKSTLIKVLAGVYRPEGGTVLIGGEAPGPGTAGAHEAGVSVIYQELSLVPHLSVAENIFLGRVPSRWGFLQRRRAFELAKDALARVGLERLDPCLPVARLSLHERQLVEVAKALLRNARVLVMDEPTSALNESDVEKLFAVVGQLREQGLAVLYISHHLKEVFAVCDSVTVLRDGAVVATRPVERWDENSLVAAMVGRDMGSMFPWRETALGMAVLEVEGLAPSVDTPDAVRPRFAVREGEIVGLFGVAGAGRTELLRMIAGITPPARGMVRLRGKQIVPRSVATMLRNGVAYSPEDRKIEGLVMVASVRENVCLSILKHQSRSGFVDVRAQCVTTGECVRKFRIAASSIEQEVGNLSGGTQQKVMLSRAMSVRPQVMLLDEPTRGVDMGAKHEIYEAVMEYVETGGSVILASSELPEVMNMSHRVLVMRAGRIVSEFKRGQARESDLLSDALEVCQEGQGRR